MENSSIQLACPFCRTALNLAEGQRLYCNQCDSVWPVFLGIPTFTNSDAYWAEPGFTRQTLQEINKKIEDIYWKDVLRNHESPLVREQHAFISDLERAKLYTFINLPKDSIVLDLGAGMGTISQALSHQYKTVYAVEPVKERTEFMSLRFKQELCHNIVVIRSDIDHLPFVENSFDLIVLNGVLEWLPFNRKSENPRNTQLFYLRLLKKLLKNNGYLYIGIENRFSYGLCMGGRDPHISLKYVTVLPRLLSHVICKYKTGDIYRPYLYSFKGYKRLLTDAGLGQIEVYSALPSYNNPKYIINMKEKSAAFKDVLLTSERKLAKIIKRVLLRINILKYFGYAYFIFGRKS